MTRFLRAICLLGLAVGCASLPPIELSEKDPQGALGGTGSLPDTETCVYSCSWNGIPAGRATFTGRTVDGTYETVGDIETTGLASAVYGLALRFEGESREADLSSLRWRLAQEGEKSVDIRFDPDAGAAHSEVRVGEEERTFAVSGGKFREPLGALYALRRSDLRPGQSFRTTIFAEESAYSAVVLVASRVSVRVPAGEFDTFLVRADLTRLENGEPVGKPQPQGVWITADERRLPVKVDMTSDIGRFVMSLRSHEVGAPVDGGWDGVQ